MYVCSARTFAAAYSVLSLSFQRAVGMIEMKAKQRRKKNERRACVFISTSEVS